MNSSKFSRPKCACIWMNEWAAMKNRKIQSWLLVLPALIALGAGYLFPLGIALYKSFFAGMNTNFVGFTNYTDLLGNYAFGLALRNLLRLWCIIIPLNLVLGVLLAVLCVEAAESWLRLAFFFPGILPAACVVMMATEGASLLGWEDTWTFDEESALVWLAIVLWKTLGYTVLICAAFLEFIPKEIIDAAKLDGAGFLQCLFRVRLPLIARGLGLCVILVIFNGYRCFREAYLIGGEYPHEELYSLQNFLQNNFSNMNYARLEAASILAVLVVFAVGLLMVALWKGMQRR